MMKKELEDMQIQGLNKDLGNAYGNYSIVKKLSYYQNEIQKLEKYDQQVFNFIVNSSKELIIIDLGKLYDVKSSRNPIRCLDEIFTILESNKEHLLNYYLTKSPLGKQFIKDYSDIINLFDRVETINIDDFIESIQIYINEEKKSPLSSVGKLKYWRDKISAHNEMLDLDKIPDISLEEIYQLIRIVLAILSFLNYFVGSDINIIEREPDTYFIDQLLKKYDIQPIKNSPIKKPCNE